MKQRFQPLLDTMREALERWRVTMPRVWSAQARGYKEGYLDGYAAALDIMQNALNKMED